MAIESTIPRPIFSSFPATSPSPKPSQLPLPPLPPFSRGALQVLCKGDSLLCVEKQKKKLRQDTIHNDSSFCLCCCSPSLENQKKQKKVSSAWNICQGRTCTVETLFYWIQLVQIKYTVPENSPERHLGTKGPSQ